MADARREGRSQTRGCRRGSGGAPLGADAPTGSAQVGAKSHRMGPGTVCGGVGCRGRGKRSRPFFQGTTSGAGLVPVLPGAGTGLTMPWNPPTPAPERPASAFLRRVLGPDTRPRDRPAVGRLRVSLLSHTSCAGSEKGAAAASRVWSETGVPQGQRLRRGGRGHAGRGDRPRDLQTYRPPRTCFLSSWLFSSPL